MKQKSVQQKTIFFVIVGFIVLMGISVGGFVLATQLQKKFVASSLVPTTSATPTIAQPISVVVQPTPPAGYSWQECKAMKAIFLKPTGWFFKEETHGDTEACFITKEEIVGTTQDEFKTGLSVNAVRHVRQKTGLSPTAYVKKFSSGDAGHTIKRRSELREIAVGPVKGYQQFIEAQNPGYDKPITMDLIAVGNDQTDSMYILWFETPSANLKENQEVANTIMGTLGLDDEF